MGLKSPIILWTLAPFPTSHLSASLSSPDFDVFSSIYWIPCSRADASRFQFTLGTYCLANCPLLCLHLSNCFLAYNSQLRQSLLQEAFLAFFLLTRSSHRILNFLSIAKITHDLNHLWLRPAKCTSPEKMAQVLCAIVFNAWHSAWHRRVVTAISHTRIGHRQSPLCLHRP